MARETFKAQANLRIRSRHIADKYMILYLYTKVGRKNVPFEKFHNPQSQYISQMKVYRAWTNAEISQRIRIQPTSLRFRLQMVKPDVTFVENIVAKTTTGKVVKYFNAFSRCFFCQVS